MVRTVSLLPTEAEEASRLVLHDTSSFSKVFGIQPEDLFVMFKISQELRLMWNGDRLDQYPPFATVYTLVHQTCVHHAFLPDCTNCVGPLGDLGAIAITLCAWERAAPFVSSKRGIHERERWPFSFSLLENSYCFGNNESTSNLYYGSYSQSPQSVAVITRTICILGWKQ